MATKVKPTRIQVTGTPQVGDVPMYVDADTFQWGAGGGGSGDVSGPASSTDGDIVLFDGTTGKLIKDSGVGLSSKLDATALSNNAYGGGWNGDTTHTPTKDALYDKIHTMDVEIGNKAADTSVVKLTGNQTIGGTKTFSTSPVVPSKTSDATNTGTAIATEAQVYNVADDVATINGKIPSAATSSNQLADKNYVNDGINSVTAYYITKNANGDQFATYAELSAATTFYSGGVQRTPTRNDYCIVQADENHDNATTRYIYNASWEYQYTVNETALTTAQLNALNSGITAAKVSTYDGYASTISGKQDALTTQTAYTTKGTSTKVPTISTNTLGQVTAITETNIAFPVTSVNGSTGDVTISVPEESNTKTFYLSSTSDLTNAQAAYDWYVAGKNAIIVYQNNTYTFVGIEQIGPSEYTYKFKSNKGGGTISNGQYTPKDYSINLGCVSNSITSITYNESSGPSYLNISGTHAGTFTPTENYHPATKKYVDDIASGKQATLVSGTNIKTINGTSVLGTGDIVTPNTTYTAGTGLALNGTEFSNSGVTSVNGSTGAVSVTEFSPSNAGTTDQVLTKTAGGYQWATASGGGDVQVSSQANNILTSGMKIRAGTQANYEGLGSYDNNTIYLTV